MVISTICWDVATLSFYLKTSIFLTEGVSEGKTIDYSVCHISSIRLYSAISLGVNHSVISDAAVSFPSDA
jgi:hypothetical protein